MPSFVVNKLVTKHDTLHMHKILGTLSLMSFLYRYAWVFPNTGTLGFSHATTNFDIVTMLIHIMLSSSSLVFHVSKKRILTHPMIIWHEYRLHAIIFTLRCLSVYILSFITQNIFVHFVVIFPHHLIVDTITTVYGDKRQTTVRVNDKQKDTFIVKSGKRMYSFYQFFASASHLAPHPRAADLAFNTLIAIQSSAFMMTLVRKNLVSYQTHIIVYSACLLLSSLFICIQFYHVLHIFLPLVSLIFFMRVHYSLNKYLLWFLFCCCYTFLVPCSELKTNVSNFMI